MQDKIDLLISILFDNTAREDEKDDAAIDLGNFDDDRALNALIEIASNPHENQMVLDSCGESIAQIWIKRERFDQNAYQKLQPMAQFEAKMYINANKPEWINLINNT